MSLVFEAAPNHSDEHLGKPFQNQQSSGTRGAATPGIIQ